LYRAVGDYAARLLKGEKPVRLAGAAADQVRARINLKTAKALDLSIPEALLATADEVIQ
jgi:putative ABC transport system substrate-binding protein